MKDKLDYLFSNKDSDIDRVAEKYTAAGNKEKEKIYEITRKKYNILREEEANTSEDGFIKEAEGVERYSRPKWIRFVSAAAAAVVLLTGVCGGVFLTRSKKVDRIDIESSNPAETVTAVEVTTITDDGEIVKVDMDKVVDKLSADLEHFHKALAQEGVDTGDSLTFSDLTYPNAPSYRNYYRVTDEKLDTFDEFEKVMGSSFSSLIREGYTGGDMSGYENGTEFDDISFIKKNLKSFINYNGNLYSEASVMPNASYSSNFANTFNFSNYELVSSEFLPNDEHRIKGLIEDGLLDDGLETMTCKRIYQRKDGTRVRAELILVNEDNAWKIGSYNVGENIEDQVVTTAAVTTAVVTTSSVNANNGEFGELQLHQVPVFANDDEANALLDEINYGWMNGTFQFKKVDTEKYTQQIWNAASFDELNTLENKSYVYHVLMNSYRYFDTAEVSYTINGQSTEKTWTTNRHEIVDNRANYFRVDTTVDTGTQPVSDSACYNQGILTKADNFERTFTTCDSSNLDYEFNYVPDNYRTFEYMGSDPGWAVICFPSTLGSIEYDCLYTYPGNWYIFENWYIEGVEEILGRQCVAVRTEENGYFKEMLMDLRTGIIMRYTEDFDNSTEVHMMSVNSINLNMPVEHTDIDLTGYARSDG